MSYSVVTITREFGSGGRTIAKKLAEELGYDYYDYWGSISFDKEVEFLKRGQ